ncbi:hypothetical protein GCM10008983_02780 [Lentibacillus halophilus]|uniref:Gas vesicle protein n=1 Tax=Lentibacillus halophilus TaxID=295065 RepID=A0ABP3IW23_9BACI
MGNNEEEGFNGNEFALGAMIGAIGGALTALLLAPKSGNELRDDINSGASDLKVRAGDWKGKAYEKGTEIKDTAVNKGSEWKDKAYEKGAELKEKAVDSKTKLTEKAQAMTSSKDGENQNNDDAQSETAATDEGTEHTLT